MKESKSIKEKFNLLYAEWEEAIQDPKIQSSSRPQDYIDNEPYREIVKLGKDALPFILVKMKRGVFFMNEAALKIAGKNLDKIIEEESSKPARQRAKFLAKETPAFLSEQQKSELILKHIQGK
ncbi:MAG: hypothetical protein MUO89_10295 [Dehalococcoidia bacterium]|nr:hypothetical protein [Dehalococcoidia bacterium]